MLRKEQQELSLEKDELRRLYHDLEDLEEVPLSEMDRIMSEGKHIQPKLEEVLFKSREG